MLLINLKETTVVIPFQDIIDFFDKNKCFTEINTEKGLNKS